MLVYLIIVKKFQSDYKSKAMLMYQVEILANVNDQKILIKSSLTNVRVKQLGYWINFSQCIS